MGKLTSIEKRKDIAIIWLDMPGEKINKISPDVISEFESVFAALDQDNEIKAAVLISRKKDFIAGADIDVFETITQPGQFQPVLKKGHASLSQLSRSKKPIVAAIHGSCLGAGTEIALACTARICSDAPATHFALPEVMLGLLPGGGGTQRLPRLIGIQKSLDMMLTGKKIYGRQAVKMGLADRITTPESLLEAAMNFAREIATKGLKRKDKRSLLEKILESNSLTRSLIWSKTQQILMKKTLGNYPAPFKILDCVKTGIEKGEAAGYAAEVVNFESLILSDESRQLIRIFFNMTAKKKNPYAPELIRKHDTIAMIGAGFMGAGITEVSVLNGMKVWLKDVKQETISAAKAMIWKTISKKLSRKSIQQKEADDIMNRITSKLDYSGFDKVDVIIEAVFEEINLKQRILHDCEQATRPDTIFATNTSALPIHRVAEKAKHPELIIGMHYFSPVPKMPLLEIIKTPQTADWVVATCFEIGIKQGKTCIVVNDGPGFYTTRILGPFLNETLLLLEEGADALQIDRALKKFGFPVGPVTLLDEVGIDVGAHVMSGEMVAHAQQREGAKFSYALKKMFDAGYCGKKNKKGFFKYNEKGKKQGINEDVYAFFGNPAKKQFTDEQISSRVAFMMLNEALLCLEENIIENPTDGDVGAVFGLGFPPFTGGPFRFIDRQGASVIVQKLENLSAENGLRFKPADILKKYAEANKTFHS